MARREKRPGWHPADIKAELEKRGLTLAAVARRHGLAGQTVRAALVRRQPKAQQAIATELAIDPSFLWPDRYENGSVNTRSRHRSAHTGVVECQKTPAA